MHLNMKTLVTAALFGVLSLHVAPLAQAASEAADPQASAPQAPAQNTTQSSAAGAGSRWNVKPQLGLTSFAIKGSNISGSRAGTMVGATATYESGIAGLSYESGVLYTEAGAKVDKLIASNEYKIGYLGVPVGARYRFTGENDAASHWYTRGGVSLAYLAVAKRREELLGLSQETDIKDQTNKLDVQPYVGLGYSWAIAEGQAVGVDFNYTRGLLDVFKSQDSKSEGYTLAGSYGINF